MAMPTLKEEWEAFAKAIFVPVEVYSAVQIQEMRLAFYAGARSMMTLAIEASHLPEIIAAAELEKIEAELLRFLKDMTEGKA